MARPLWLRLFGPNGPTTISELRDALLNASFGQGLGDGHVTARLLELGGRTPVPIDRPGPGVDGVGGRDIPTREQASLAAAVVTEHNLAATTAPGGEAIAVVGAPVPQDAPVNLAAEDSPRNASLYINSVVPGQGPGSTVHSPFASLDLAAPYMMLGDMQTGLVINTHEKTLMQGGPGDYPELFAGPNDTVELDGDYSAGFALGVADYVEQVIARAGNDYNLIADDASVAAGHTLTVNAMPLGSANHMLFDGSAETDGRYIFYGSEGGDVFLGGAGNDLVYGLGGADILSGGGGGDTFVYYDAAHSSGPDFDILADFNPSVDKIDLEVSVAGFDTAIQSGSLSEGSFNADLGAALAGLGAGRAVLYAPNAGDLAGTIFLVVDANGQAGYQAGEDYVFALTGTTLTDLTGHPGFFI